MNIQPEYTDEFKQKAVKLVLERGDSIKKASDHLGSKRKLNRTYSLFKKQHRL